MRFLFLSASDDSTPELTSIHQGFIETAFLIFSEFIPPASTYPCSSEILLSKLQSKTLPVPPYELSENVSNSIASADEKSLIDLRD